MPKHKTRVEGRDKPRPTPDVQEKPEAPEKKAGPLPAPAMRAPEEATGAAGRARTMTDMQQALGNARVSRMLGTTVQTKPVVDTPDSPAEQEADREAETVMRMPISKEVRRVWSEDEGKRATQAPAIMRTPKTWGTEKTTSPVAEKSPQKGMLDELQSEVQLFQLAKKIVAWAKGKPTKKSTGTDSPLAHSSFTVQELLTDKGLVRRLKPRPKSAADLTPVLDLLVHYGVLSRITVPVLLPFGVVSLTFYDVVTDPSSGEVATGRLLKAEKEVTEFKRSFEKRVKRKDPLYPVVETDLLPQGMSSGRKHKEIKEEAEAEANLTKVKAQVEAELDEFVIIRESVGKTQPRPIFRVLTDTPTAVETKSGKGELWEVPVAGRKKPLQFRGGIERIERVRDGTHAETKRRREKLLKRIEKAEMRLKRARRYRTFAKVNVAFLTELWKRNKNWRAGNYVGHSWGEFSIDIFIRPGVSSGFYSRPIVTKFFEDVNAVAEAGVGDVKKFAWRALYNDDPLRHKINKRFGNRRVLHVPNHGPAPDHKLHIHLDLRPVEVKKDTQTGYKKEDGRIKLK